MKFQIFLLFTGTLVMAGTYSGTVTLLDGTPLADALIRIGTDSIVTNPTGRFSIGFTTGLGRRSEKPIPVTSHLVVDQGHPHLIFSGTDASGRIRFPASKPNISISARGSARSAAQIDTLSVYWKGNRLMVLPITNPDSSDLALAIDTAWKDDAGIPWNPRIHYGTLLDPRDNQAYRTVRIGTQTWMAENLNFQTPASWWYENRSDRGAKFGRLYGWLDALAGDTSHIGSDDSIPTQGVCPSGWHVPTYPQWIKLNLTVDSASPWTKGAFRLKSTSGWFPMYLSPEKCQGSDIHGFRAIPSGLQKGLDPNLVFSHVDSASAWWTSTRWDGADFETYVRYISATSFDSSLTPSIGPRYAGMSIRCIRD